MQKMECFEEDFPSNNYCPSPSGQYPAHLQVPTSSMSYGMGTTEMLLSNLNSNSRPWSATAEFIEHSGELPFGFTSSQIKREEQADDPMSMHLIPLINEGEMRTQQSTQQQLQNRPIRDSLGGKNRKLHDLDRAQILKNFSLGLYSSKVMKNEEFAMLRDDKGLKVAIRCLACSAIFSPCVGGHLNYHRRNACPGTQRSQDQSRETIPKAAAITHATLPSSSSPGLSPQIQMINSAARMCALDGTSPSILLAPGFRQFLQCLVDQLSNQQPAGGKVDHMLPHPSLVWKHMRRKMQSEQPSFCHDLKNQLKSCGLAVSLQLEAGKWLQTAYFIADDWTLQSKPLETFEASTPENLTEGVKSSLNRLGLTNLEAVSIVLPEVSCVATNVRCALSWLNWLVKNAVDCSTPNASISTLLGQLREVFEFLREWSVLSDDLLVRIWESTDDLRWFSPLKLVAAFKQLTEQQKTRICKALKNESAALNKPQNSTQTQMSRLFDSLCQQQESLYEVLELFQPVLHAVDTLNNSKAPTIHKVLPVLQNLKHHFQQVQLQPGCSTTVQVIAQSVLDLLNQEWKGLLSDQHYFALILDPSEKNKIREYLQSKEQRDQLTQRFKSAVLFNHNLHKKDPSEEIANRKSLNLSDSYFDVDVAISVADGTDADIEKEVIAYLCTPTIPTVGVEQVAILQFWQQSQQQFPSCARFAKKIMAIPACSSTLEGKPRRFDAINQMRVEQILDLNMFNTLLSQ